MFNKIKRGEEKNSSSIILTHLPEKQTMHLIRSKGISERAGRERAEVGGIPGARSWLVWIRKPVVLPWLPARHPRARSGAQRQHSPLPTSSLSCLQVRTTGCLPSNPRLYLTSFYCIAHCLSASQPDLLSTWDLTPPGPQPKSNLYPFLRATSFLPLWMVFHPPGSTLGPPLFPTHRGDLGLASPLHPSPGDRARGHQSTGHTTSRWRSPNTALLTERTPKFSDSGEDALPARSQPPLPALPAAPETRAPSTDTRWPSRSLLLRAPLCPSLPAAGPG